MELLTFEWRRARSIRTTWVTSLFVILGALFFAFLGTVRMGQCSGCLPRT